MRFLVIGDMHVTDRAQSIPYEIQKGVTSLCQESPFDGVFCTGDLTTDPGIPALLQEWASTGFLKVVQGNMDAYKGIQNPVFESHEVPNTQIEIGLYHGTKIRPRGDRESTEKFARQRDIQIMITGHSHKQDIFLAPSGILLLNPGSCVGAWSFVASGIPSFILMSIVIPKIEVVLYESRQLHLQASYFAYQIKGKKIVEK